jgi:taurine--2-oxoglutarate transaminase
MGAHHVVYGWQIQDDQPPVCIRRSSGVHLWTADDRRLTDLCSGQINVNVGYGHPHILAKMRHQLDSISYVAPMFATEPRSRLATLIAERLPRELEYVFFTSSGSESIEVAIKVARAVTGRLKIYSAWRSYHGASAGASAISGDPRRLFIEPGLAGVNKFHGATCYCCPYGQAAPPACAYACLEALKNSILQDGPETVAAIVLEPISGTSGLYIPPVEYVRGVRRFCTDHGILLIFDETMTGWGRTGRWFALEHFGVIPDLLTTAKGITSAYVPLGATIMTAAVRDCFKSRAFVAGSTNEGHTLACAAAIANIEVYEQQNLIDKSLRMGGYLLERLEEIKGRHPSVGDVRGKGLFACIELTSHRAQRRPLAGYRDCRRNVSSELTRRLLEAGVFVIAKWDYVFIAPPLVISKEELDEGLGIIDAALSYTDEVAERLST